MPQSSLFSFFNKKPSTTSAAASTPASSNAQTKKPALSASNDSLKSDVSKEPIKPIPMSKEIAPVSSLSDSHQKEVIFHKSEDDKMCVDGDDDVSTKRPRPSSMNDGDSSSPNFSDETNLDFELFLEILVEIHMILFDTILLLGNNTCIY